MVTESSRHTSGAAHCTGCGAVLSADASFCTVCGRPTGAKKLKPARAAGAASPGIRKFVDPLPVAAEPSARSQRSDRSHTRTDEPPRRRQTTSKSHPQVTVREGLQAGGGTVVIESGLGDAASAPAMKATLFLPSGDYLPVTLGSEEDRLILGRDPEHCALVVDDARVSRQHAAIGVRGAVGYVQDLGSANGTFVNNEQVTTRRDLHDGDVMRLGQTEIGYREG